MPSAPSFVVEATPSPTQVAVTYLHLGVEHILLGVDHLLFVLRLLLMVRAPWMLMKTVTAFTVAHSITLAIAILGYANGVTMAAAGLGMLAIAGVGTALCVVLALLAALVVSLQRSWTRIAVRVAGSWIAAGGMLMLGWSLKAGI